MPEAAALQIESEDEAWEYLQLALAGEIPDDLAQHIKFKGWPRLDIYLPNTPVDSSMSPTMMEALIDFQKSLYRTHAAITAGDPRVRLTNAEKEQLEFRVKVEGGSSKLGLDLTQLAETWGVAALGRMTPGDTMTAIIATIIAVAGVTSFLAFLKHRTDVRKAELESREKEHFFDTFKTLSAEDTKRQELWLAAMTQVPVLAAVKAELDQAKTEIVRAVGEEGGGNINGLQLDQDVANDLTTNARRRAEDEQVRAQFTVSRVDTTAPDGFRVTLRFVEDGKSVTASLMDALISEEHRKRIREAEWNKQPVMVELKVRTSRGKIVEATVVDVQEPPAAAA